MSILSTISEALHLYGKAINRNTVTNVIFEFKNFQTDLPSTPTWEVIIRLVGKTYSADLRVFNRAVDGQPEPEVESLDSNNFETVFSQEFKGEADSEEMALKAAYDQIKGRIEYFLRAREEETAFAQQAMMSVTTDEKTELTSLWETTNTSAESQPEEP
jgi:hypothetical protein